MKKTLFFGLMAAALGFTACSSDDDLSVSNDNNQKKGMVLRATVEQPADSRAAISDAWKFAFATGDAVSVTNTKISTYYTFTNNGTQFKSEDAQATETDATWYAYFPSNTIDLTNQSGTQADVANKYALAGATATATTGKDGLNITMSPKVAILVINNQKGSIDINVKSSATKWVTSLTACEDGFTVSTADTKQSLLSATATGTYYVAVPAGVQLAVKDGDKTIKSTGASGLTAGKYYNIIILPEGFVDLGVKTADGKPLYWAKCNLGANNPEDPGDYYMWGATTLIYSAVDHSKTSDAFTFKTTNPYVGINTTWGNAKGFDWDNTPFTNDVFILNKGGILKHNVFIKYTTSNEYYSGGDAPDNFTTLKPEDDIATTTNSKWHIPTKDDFYALAANCVWIWTDSYNGKGMAGYVVHEANKNEDKGKINLNGTWKAWDASNSKFVTNNTGSEPNTSDYGLSCTHIFLPAAGFGNQSSLSNLGKNGGYFTSSLNDANNSQAYGIVFTKSIFNIGGNNRSYGYSIRPVLK